MKRYNKVDAVVVKMQTAMIMSTSSLSGANNDGEQIIGDGGTTSSGGVNSADARANNKLDLI